VRRLSHPPPTRSNLSDIVVAEFLVLVLFILHCATPFAGIPGQQGKSHLVVKGRLHRSRDVFVAGGVDGGFGGWWRIDVDWLRAITGCSRLLLR
jgi:hypothetical protein